MRKVIFIALIFMSSTIFGQVESKTSITGGAKALLFEFSGLSSLSADSYEGGIGGKIFFNNSMALRIMLNFDRFSEENPANATGTLNGVKGEYVSTSFGLGAGMEFHLTSMKRVSPYFGGGIGFTRFSSEDKEAITYFPGSDASRTVTEISGRYQFDLVGVLGAEVFIIKEVSLSAEYIFNIGFFSDGDTKYTEVAVSGTPILGDSQTVKGDSGWEIGTGSRGRLILSIYF